MSTEKRATGRVTPAGRTVDATAAGQGARPSRRFRLARSALSRARRARVPQATTATPDISFNTDRRRARAEGTGVRPLGGV